MVRNRLVLVVICAAACSSGPEPRPADTSQPSAPPAAGRKNGLNGYYRAGSDHRKDGQAVGW